MPVSTAMADRNALGRAAARRARYPIADISAEEATPTLWDANRISNIIDWINRGQMQVVEPPPVVIPGTREAFRHSWNFLRTETTLNAFPNLTGHYGSKTGTTIINLDSTASIALLTTYDPEMIGKTLVFSASGNSYVISAVGSTTITLASSIASEAASGTFTIASSGDYRLPDNMSRVYGPLCFARDKAKPKIEFVEPERVRDERAASNRTGIPTLAAKAPRLSDQSASPGWAIMLYPIPDQYYALSYEGGVMPNNLTAANPYPLGGAQHSLTYIASVEAVVEFIIDGKRGESWAYFMERLAASVQADMADFASQRRFIPQRRRWTRGGPVVVVS